MKQLSSTPVDWVGKEYQGFVVNAAFTDENAKKITSWLCSLRERVPEGIYTTEPGDLHITLIDWIAPLLDYKGSTKSELFQKLRPSYDSALREVTKAMPPFDVHFSEIRVAPGAIILTGQDGGQFQAMREQFLQRVSLPDGGKQPPNIIHSSLVRFIPPAIDLAPVQEFASTHPLDFTQPVSAFRLVETKRAPMQDSSVLDSYLLLGA
jgi:hypothetical protein